MITFIVSQFVCQNLWYLKSLYFSVQKFCVYLQIDIFTLL